MALDVDEAGMLANVGGLATQITMRTRMFETGSLTCLVIYDPRFLTSG